MYKYSAISSNRAIPDEIVTKGIDYDKRNIANFCIL